MSKIKFYSAWYCPFAQRVWMGLDHKNIDYEYIETDPYDKTSQWLEISRATGQVPVIVDQNSGVSIPDSIRGLEYLDAEYSQGSNLYPQNNSGVAEAKFWIDYQARAIIPYFYRLLKAEAGSKAADGAKFYLEKGLEDFAEHMDPYGPFFFGNKPGAVDISFAPFALRIELLLFHYNDYTLPGAGDKWIRYHQWWEAMADNTLLRETSTGLPDYTDRLLEFYLPYSKGGGQANVSDIR